jgi:pimeloyl-ACP methyl ester carboxylesterase
MRKVLRITTVALGTVVVLCCVVVVGYVINNLNYFNWGMARVWRAGYVEKQVMINGSVMNYAEGPDNGPALLLIHGQSGDWQNYYPVLPNLAKRYHVYAVDCYGHGKSARVPEKYTNVAMGRDLQQFLIQVVGKLAIVSGHSSGGLLAAWLAAYAPEQVSSVVLEDPPVFTTLLPRAEKTWNWVDLATMAHTFVATGQTDWVRYDAEHERMWKFFGNSKQGLLKQALNYHAQHPGQSIKWWELPPIMNESFRAMDHYDPRFGDAFYTGSWDTGFDHEATLAAIHVPAVFIHTNWSYDPDGILLGATDGKDAALARSLIKGVQFYQVNSGHGFHWEKPDAFVKIVDDLANRVRR